MFHKGSQIGLYTLVRKLGKGGFGEVWLAERKSKFVTTKVAVKLPHDEQVDHEAIKQEAQLWEQASGHPNILPIIDADEYDGQIVIVSEYAPDGSLDEWLKAHGKMPIEKAVEITIKILDGLEFLHSRNIIHRDLKPANILLQGDTPRLADFGISRALRTTATSQSSNVSGTFAYMPPEGFDGKRSVQTDVWSVGINLYQFLTGTLPFPQKEPSALIAAIMMREFEPLPSDVPNNLQNAIAKALAKQPENRYASASEMREDLRRVLRSEAVSDFIQSDSQENLVTEQVTKIRKSSPFSAQNSQDENETVVREREHISPKPSDKSQSFEKKSIIKTRSKGNEIVAISLSTLAVLLFLCLVTFNPNDWSLNSTGSPKTQNWLGVVGSVIADLLFQVIGLTAYFLPVLLSLIAWRFFRAERFTVSFGRVIGYIFFVFSVSALASLFDFRGGSLGVFFAQNFAWLLGRIGAGILLFTVLATAILLITNLHLLRQRFSKRGQF